MTIISGILALLALLFLVMAVVGLIKPSWVKQDSRGKAFGGGLVLFILFSIGAGLLAPASDKTTEGKNDTAQEKVDEVSPKVADTPVVKQSKPIAKAHGYKVIGARDYSIKANSRKGGQWHIVSDAVSKADRAATMMMAAQDLLKELNNGQVASIWFYLDEGYYKHGNGQVGRTIYVPDGKGERGEQENVSVWEVMVSDTRLTTQQRSIIDAWYQHTDQFKDNNNIVDEAKLDAFLTKKLNVTQKEISQALLPLLTGPQEPYFKKGESADFKIERIGQKSSDSIANPEVFSRSICQDDLRYWAEKHSFKASHQCQKAVERIAKYDFEWTVGWLDSKFSHYRWKDRKRGVVTYIGDKLKLQNGFGAWQNYVYSCDFLPSADGSGTVLDIQAEPGRL